jgi:signal transduction histidine kinase
MNPDALRTVLIADDVPALRRLIKITLDATGRFEVVGEAGTGAEAIEQARQRHPDLVLLDLSMPQMDGLEALPHVIDASPGSRVVVFSGFDEQRMGPVARRMGAAAYLEKGLEPDRLVEALLKVLSTDASQNTTEPVLSIQRPPTNGTNEGELRRQSGAMADSLTREFRVALVGATSEQAIRLGGWVEGRPGVRFRLVGLKSVQELTQPAKGDFELVVLMVGADRSIARARIIEALGAIGGLPLVAITPHEDPKCSELAMKLGVEDCLSEPSLDTALMTRSLLFAIERRKSLDARQASAMQQKELARARDLEEMKTSFFNAAAHELYTPLTPIKLQLHMLRSADPGNLRADQSAALDVLDRNVERLQRLTNDLLDVARMEAGHLRMEKAAVDVGRLADECVGAFVPMAAKAGVSLSLTGRPGAFVQGDPVRISQVLYNLVSNAIRFTPRGGQIAIRVTSRGDQVECAVEDSGAGLTPGQIDRLFRPFSQVHLDAPGLPATGTGLGLFICKGIITLHGGRIWCRSGGTGRGSTFLFSLPAASVSLPGSFVESSPEPQPAR